jgi:putative DNA methylase
MAVIANGPLGRVYLPPTIEQIEAAESARPDWSPGMDLPNNPRDFKTPNYGLTKFSDLFTSRQLVALATFSDLVPITMEKARIDAINAGITDDNIGLDAGGRGATAYAQAVGTYLSFAVDYATNYWSTITTPAEGFIRGTFSRQALPMTWDFAEAPPFGSTSGNWMAGIEWISKALSFLPGSNSGFAMQADAAAQKISSGKLISTDPPYYDNIGYADLSDFFYVWQRKTLRPIFPGLYATLAVPKAEELVATPYRHGGKIQAENFFLNGMTRAIQNLVDQAHPAFPITIYYAFKQSETKENSGTASTGWETFLEAILRAGFAINGTWPMRTERGARSIGIGSNALASSIILVCSKRESIATISRRDFQRELREQMPEALEVMIGGQAGATPIAPVDLAQAAIGPGMAIFSKYAGVLEADGTTMSVHSALIMINKEITDFLTPDAGNYDADTLFCSAWFDQFGWSKGAFGEADVLARGKGTSVDGVKDAGVIESGGGKVRLLKWQEYPADWDPETDNRTPVWESLHQLIRVLNQKGESDAGALLARMPERAEQIRQLAYHLYTLCERKKWAEEARAYNELITSWHGIVTASQDAGVKGTQADFEF